MTLPLASVFKSVEVKEVMANDVDVARRVERLPAVSIVVEAVEPKATLPPVRYVANKLVPVAFVNVSPPLKFRSVEVAFEGNKYPKLA